MSRYFPHADYAEDQPYGKTILTAHVLYRGFQTGAVIGLGIGAARSLVRRKPFAIVALAQTGYGALVGTVLMIPGLPFYMYNKTDIEWKDRSWRLLENEGQKEVDDWSSVGFVGGALAALRSPAVRQAGRVSLVRIAGGAALGDLLGVTGYMVCNMLAYVPSPLQSALQSCYAGVILLLPRYGRNVPSNRH